MRKIILILTITLSMYLSLKAQNDTNVIYIDYNPDIVLYGDYFNNIYDSLRIDLNQDAILDFKIYFVYSTQGPLSYVKNLNNNCKYALYSFLYISKYDTLNSPSINWYSGANFWNTSQNKDTMAIKITSGNDNYYGWICVSIDVIDEKWAMIIDKYAFCKIPNYPFHLGQTELITGMNMVNNSDSTSVFIDGTGNLKVESSKSIANVTITNLQGAVVASESNINSNNASISTAGFAQGSYIVQVVFEDGSVCSRQIVL